MILVCKSGLLTSIQDLGRPGYGRYGIPPSGALDPQSARLANSLVGNGPHAPLLEITLQGPQLAFQTDVLIALSGANLSPTLNGHALPMGQSFLVEKGDLLSFGQIRSGGCRTYLAIAGGIQAQRHLGSCATYPPARLGGLNGLPLQKGDLLSLAAKRPFKIHATAKQTESLTTDKNTLRFLPGPEWKKLSKHTRQEILEKTFTVHSQSNRMAIRFREKLSCPNFAFEMLSSPTPVGSLQLTPDGSLLLLMHDGPTTGGYPRPGILAMESLLCAAQLPPLSKVVFKLK